MSWVTGDTGLSCGGQSTPPREATPVILHLPSQLSSSSSSSPTTVASVWGALQPPSPPAWGQAWAGPGGSLPHSADSGPTVWEPCCPESHTHRCPRGSCAGVWGAGVATGSITCPPSWGGRARQAATAVRGRARGRLRHGPRTPAGHLPGTEPAGPVGKWRAAALPAGERTRCERRRGHSNRPGPA